MEHALDRSHPPAGHYPVPLEDDLEDMAGAGTLLGHFDRGGISGAAAGAVGYANSGSIKTAAVSATGGFLGGFASSVYNGGWSGAGNSRGRVICTHFFRRGMMSRELWRADLEFTFSNLSTATIRGYQYWAIPYVKLMRRSPLAERIMFPLAKVRAEEIAYQIGLRPKGNIFGKVVRLIGESICFSVGMMVDQKDYEQLYHTDDTKIQVQR